MPTLLGWWSGYITGKPRQRPSACVACRCSQGIKDKGTWRLKRLIKCDSNFYSNTLWEASVGIMMYVHWEISFWERETLATRHWACGSNCPWRSPWSCNQGCGWPLGPWQRQRRRRRGWPRVTRVTRENPSRSTLAAFPRKVNKATQAFLPVPCGLFEQ